MDRIVKFEQGNQSSAEELLPLLYEALRKLAYSRMATERNSHTLQPTALVHEVWIKMESNDNIWHNSAHFFASASRVMRDVLADHARRRSAIKRGGNRKRIDLDDLDLYEPMRDDFILLVEDALEQLEELNPKWAALVVMKFYGGMTNQEIAEEMGISKSSVERYWAAAKAWLIHQMTADREIGQVQNGR